MSEDAFGIVRCQDIGRIMRLWRRTTALVVESQARQQALKQLDKRLAKQLLRAQSELRQLCQQHFACEQDARIAAARFESVVLHQLGNVEVHEVRQHIGRGRPRKDAGATFSYQVQLP